jgi:RNA polymerase sigma-70 factor (ECF subfamily)
MWRPPEGDVCDPKVLARLVTEGHSEALDRITRCYGDRLMRAARRHCRSEVEAEDAVQDTFVVAAERAREFRGEGSLEGWLVRIVASACNRISRGMKNDARRHQSDIESESRGESPETEASRREIAQALDDALLSFTPEDRLVLLLAEVEGCTGEEISRQTGLSHGAVRTRLGRLRSRLRERLGPAFDRVQDLE